MAQLRVGLEHRVLLEVLLEPLGELLVLEGGKVGGQRHRDAVGSGHWLRLRVVVVAVVVSIAKHAVGGRRCIGQRGRG